MTKGFCARPAWGMRRPAAKKMRMKARFEYFFMFPSFVGGY
jgi:hypothetical protein